MACSVDCGEGGFQTRRRYCANPLPQGGPSMNCTGEFEERRDDCQDKDGKPLPKCPINCEISNWMQWSKCSITCGNEGEGSQIR